MKFRERRKRRSENTTKALKYQLDACRRQAALEGMVLSDESGVCLAQSGNAESCDEVAARLPLMGSKVRNFEGVLYSADRGWEVRMRRFRVFGAELYVAAIGGNANHRRSQLAHSIGGLSRILAPAEA